MDRHRATTSTGAVVDQPDAVQLADLVAEVDRHGAGNFLFCERRAGGSGECYLQARREQHGWVLELRDGGPARHYCSRVDDAAIVYSAVASWVGRARAWQGLTWQRVSFGPETVGLAVAG